VIIIVIELVICVFKWTLIHVYHYISFGTWQMGLKGKRWILLVILSKLLSEYKFVI